jgi:hypothetical protein
MLMRTVSKLMWTVLAAAALSACTATVENTASYDDGKVGVTGVGEVRSEVKKPAELGTLRETVIDGDAVTLTYDGDAPAFAEGDVILGTEQQGYLRRVTGVEVQGQTVRLATVAADVGEAFDSLDIEAPSVRVQPEQALTVPATDRDTRLVADDGTVYTAHVTYEAAATPRSASVDFAWEFPDLKIDVADPTGHVVFSASAQRLRVNKQLVLDFGVHTKFFKVDDMRFIVDDTTKYSIDRFSVQVEGKLPRFSQSIPLIESPVLATIPVGPFIFTIGGGVSIGVDALLSAAVELHTTSDVSLTTRGKRGVTWNGSFHPVNETSFDVDTDVGTVEVGRADATLDADLFVNGHINFALFGVAGPELFGKITPVSSHLTVGFFGWKVTLSAKASGGVSFVIPVLRLEPFRFDFPSFQKQYFEKSGTF